MELLLLSIAGCMAIDVLMILQKSRVQVDGLSMDALGIRADTIPKRYNSVELVCHVEGPRDEDQAKVARALELSREKYCSVLHTLDPDLAVEIRVARG
jgi:putative redox protein